MIRISGLVTFGSLALFALAAIPQSAEAQVTAKALIGDAVSVEGEGKYKDVDNAITRFKNGDVKAAHQYLVNAKKADAKLPPAEVVLAKLFFLARNPQGARAWLEKAVTETPADPEAYLIFAENAFSEGRVTDAELLFNKSAALAKTFKENAKRQRSFRTRSLQGLAEVAARRDDWKAVKTYVDEWVALDPDSAQAYHVLGVAQFNLEKPTEAYAALEKSEKIQIANKDKNWVSAETRMGELFERKSQRGDATKYMEFAAKNHPKEMNVRLAITNWAIRTNQTDIALAHSDAAVKLDETSLMAKLQRGTVARLRGDSKVAERYFEMAHLQSPGAFATSNNLALVLIESKDDDKKSRAVEFAQMNVQRYPLNGNSQERFEAATTFGWVLYQLGRLNEAEQALQAAAQSGSLSPDAAYYIARIWFEKQKLEEAQKLLESALEPDVPMVHRKAATQLLDTLKKKAAPSSRVGAK
jgi:tetratricopeptide (TPR) repeat protein